MHKPMLTLGLLRAVLTLLALSAGCAQDEHHGQRARSVVLRLAVTTSTRDSGLLDQLVPAFERQHDARVDVIAVGTGKALKLGEAGDVDVLLVHSRDDEDAFMEAGHGVRREDVMYNTFELLGPAADPAKIRAMEASAALEQIATTRSRFVSRGDQSGTHKRELRLWKLAGGRPQWDGYIESGQGMGRALVMADQMKAYVLADRGTYLAFRRKLELVPLAAQSEVLKNPYGIIVVNPKKNEHINARLAQAFVDFMVSPEVQRVIEQFRVDDEPLFHPLRTGGKE